jgi:NADH:ubiquinone oxidoreductase subunit 6 (subunit J)
VSEAIFFLAALGAIGGALGVVVIRNAFYSVLALVVHLISLAALFLLLRAEFVAAAQVVVYAGAVMVLYVFVVAYVGGAEEPLRRRLSGARAMGAVPAPAAMLFAGALLAELCVAVLGSGLKGIDGEGAGYVAGFGSPAQIGELLLTKFLAAFEIASYLLLIAAVGAVVLARRRGGLRDDDAIAVGDLLRTLPAAPGSMREAGARGHRAGTMAEAVDSPSAVPTGAGDPGSAPASANPPTTETGGW